MRIKNTTFLILIISIFGSCNNIEKETASSIPTIVTTTGILADAAKNIVGDSAKVIALMGPGVDPHLYKATQGDLTQLTNADVVVYNGLHLEGKMGEVLGKLGKLRPVISGGKGVPYANRRNSTQFQRKLVHTY